jgi:predicted kinase
MSYLVIMQGASGSGKTTLANVLSSVLDAVVHSTDDLMNNDEGKYDFRPHLLGEMHAKNLARATDSMEAGFSVIVDNTNTQAWEAREYVKVGVRLGFTIKFVRCEGEYNNSHGVPPHAVLAMRQRLEKLSVESCLAAVALWEK